MDQLDKGLSSLYLQVKFACCRAVLNDSLGLKHGRFYTQMQTIQTAGGHSVEFLA